MDCIIITTLTSAGYYTAESAIRKNTLSLITEHLKTFN